MSVTEVAPAKLNLALHVTGQRPDGYHLLDSLVVFAAAGDKLTLDAGPLSLSVDGPFASGLDEDDNLCLKAARLAGGQAAIRLTKTLPVAAGIGGGSADAAAVLRGLARMGVPIPDATERLGADLPVCLAARPARMRGVGEIIEPVPEMPDLRLVLVNPRVEMPTPQVFSALQRKDNAPLPAMPDRFDLPALVAYLQTCRNDLEAPAITLCPQIATVLRELRDAGALLARMSGSGATCFGIFTDASAAGLAAYRIGAAHENWWVTATGLAPPPQPV
ncbi:4-diphosphocytidyl-2-C-methyl-D-erythritol kinase [Paracoccus isoporae]|uniref:4-diphosphocytidyl-2-C-methyl-D-erythritol kinase n=1 Tax=Paracoccus isoporae TaxID=591205 RepID=A0A1G6Z300_9RHOB|nr:4-(cytidine 5'-diphospho)-2-C-methyl-D-erythritol kinase [Paracoccus isoporae]SDD96235.1 4-diphosphocytidyl-2-C-methyl-D-erythritol kinase [Paracoccus isoporae]